MGGRVKKRIDGLGEVVGGATPSTKVGAHWDGDIPWICPKDLSGYQGRYISHGQRNISQIGLDSCSTKLLPKGTILFSSRAPIGYVAIAANPICTNQGFKSIIPNRNVDTVFLYYLLKANVEKIKALGTGTTFKEVSGAVMKSIEVEVPDSLDEQRQIALVLGALDDKIALNTHMNACLEELLEQEYERRFSGCNNFVPLGDCLDISTASLKPQEHVGEVWEHYSIPAYDSNRRPIVEPAADIKSNKYIVNDNCLLVSKLNPEIKRTWMPACESTTCVCSTEFIVYKPKRPEYRSFFFSTLSSAGFSQFLCSHTTGSTGSRQRVKPKETLAYPSPAPGEDAIVSFCHFANPVYALIKRNLRETDRLVNIRDALLPKLMSGEIDVSGVDVGAALPSNQVRGC